MENKMCEHKKRQWREKEHTHSQVKYSDNVKVIKYDWPAEGAVARDLN